MMPSCAMGVVVADPLLNTVFRRNQGRLRDAGQGANAEGKAHYHQQGSFFHISGPATVSFANYSIPGRAGIE